MAQWRVPIPARSASSAPGAHLAGCHGSPGSPGAAVLHLVPLHLPQPLVPLLVGRLPCVRTVLMCAVWLDHSSGIWERLWLASFRAPLPCIAHPLPILYTPCIHPSHTPSPAVNIPYQRCLPNHRPMAKRWRASLPPFLSRTNPAPPPPQPQVRGQAAGLRAVGCSQALKPSSHSWCLPAACWLLIAWRPIPHTR